MAESVITVVVETLGTLLAEKIVFLDGVEKQVRRLQDELVRISCFLKDADRKQDDDERIRNWVSEIRHVSYDAEDAIELFITRIQYLRKKPFHIRFPMKIHYLNKVGRQIQSIQSRIKDIKSSRETYGISNLGHGTNDQAQELRHLRRRSSEYSQDKNIVGIEEKADFLVSQLLKEDGSRCVFSITGMGGVGKTTLARRVYNHPEVEKEFSCRAWVCVSERFNFGAILRTIIKQVESDTNDSFEMMQDDDLKRMLYRCLKGKRYLIVLDDVWQEEGWDVLVDAFPDEGKGNRMLLTSRKKSVAQHANPLRNPYELRTLEEGESWMLFVKTVFSDGKCPSHLEGLGRGIVSHCGGLPLAIVTVGSFLLQKRKLQSEWESVLDDIGRYVSTGRNGVSTVLELSYRDLPSHLKFCFNYLGLFPEDYVISKKKLIHLWIAEGIVVRRDGARCAEDVAADYLEQLISRNMVQVGKVTFDDRIKSCRLHDFLRDLAIRKGKDENSLEIIMTERRAEETSVTSSRYISIHGGSPFLDYLTPRIRTILCFRMNTFTFKRIKALRVLDLETCCITRLPNEIGEMSLLRYLGLRATKINVLPQSLSRLQHLQTLDVYTYMVDVAISNVIGKLECLQHFYAWNVTSSENPLGLERLQSLRTLCGIHSDDVLQNNLTSLEKLEIRLGDESKIDKLWTSLSQLKNLCSLSLNAISYTGYAHHSMDAVCSLVHLSELKFRGRLYVLPPLPPNLSRMYLKFTELGDESIPVLAGLKRLSFLKLDYGAYAGSKLTIPSSGFNQLNFLEFRTMYGLEEVKIYKGALRELKCIRIRNCKNLKVLPQELASISSLEKLELVNMPMEFVSRVLNGPDSYKISRIPTVRCVSY